MSVAAMGIFRFFVCLFLFVLSSASFAIDTDNDGLPETYTSTTVHEEIHERGDIISITFEINKFALDEAVLSVMASGDIDDSDEFVEVYFNGNQLGQLFSSINLGCEFWGNSCEDSITISKDIINNSANEGSINLEFFIPPENGAGQVAYEEIKLSYNVKQTSSNVLFAAANQGLCVSNANVLECWQSGYIQNSPELLNPRKIVGGVNSFCALDDTGLVCWPTEYATRDIPDLIDPQDVAVSMNSTCVIVNAEVNCWSGGELEDNVPALANPTQISSGDYHTCVIDDSGVVCWGKNEYGQLEIPELSNPSSISVGKFHTCAIDETGVVCWGWNHMGQASPPDISNPIAVSSGGYHSCAIDESELKCWGLGTKGQTNVPQLINPVQIVSGQYFSCAQDDTGIVCWGDKSEYTIMVMPDLNLDTNNNLISEDLDNDGIANDIDADIDGDGMLNELDALPLDANEQIDSDADGVGDNTDADNDNDGVINSLDLFPLDAFESADSDGDGVGDNADFFPNSAEYSLDSDLDQMPDAWERKYGLNPADASDALLDQDNDGLTALEEYEAGTIPLKILDIDADGNVDALTDGLIILRYLFNLRGDNLVNGAIGENAMRTEAADVEAYIQSLMPSF
jgi:hypothetical protein